jgi:2-dehydro-3-deoxyphosphogluconate aldolase / (4S)-4-hydroxy-2-oxoglutarate aldolase
MARTKEQIFATMVESGVVGVIRAPSKEILTQIAEALLAGGIPSIEVTMSTPKVIAGIELLADQLGDKAIIGVGTCLDEPTCRDAIAAGAQFVVSPMYDPHIVEATRRYDKISIPGAYTPTEILTAWVGGADVVKVFPATTLGPGYFKDVLAPLPQVKLTPTGGVTVKTTPEFIKAGAIFVGAGSALVSKDAMANSDWAAITTHAKAFVEAVKSARK